MAVPQLQHPDRIVNQIQQNLATGISKLQTQLEQATPSNGVFIYGTALSTGNNTISHSLGRVPTGFLVIDTNAPATIYRTSSTKTTLVLNASQTATISLFIF